MHVGDWEDVVETKVTFWIAGVEQSRTSSLDGKRFGCKTINSALEKSKAKAIPGLEHYIALGRSANFIQHSRIVYRVHLKFEISTIEVTERSR